MEEIGNEIGYITVKFDLASYKYVEKLIQADQRCREIKRVKYKRKHPIKVDRETKNKITYAQIIGIE